MNNGNHAAKKIAAIAILTALSLITFIIENQFPSLIIPGAKMGLANIFSFAALIMYSPIEAFIIVAIRTGLGAVFAGNAFSLLYSFTGGVVSMAVSSLLLYVVYPRISVLSVSIIAAVMHNVTQVSMFVLTTSTVNMFATLPYYLLLGVLSGAIVGGVIMLIFKGIPKSMFDKMLASKAKQNNNSENN